MIPHGAGGEEEKGNGSENMDDDEELDRKIEDEAEKYTDEERKQRIEEDCDNCGPGVPEIDLCMLGLDVEALFPSLTAARTGEIVRKRLMRSPMKVEGFNWRMGLVYITMNKNLTPNLGKMWKILPYRRKVGGTAPGMSSKAMSGKNGRLEDQWVFKVKEITREQEMEIIGRCAEIAIRIVFGNFTYNFGGKIFLQRSGGPIGARLTMACSRIVMQDWGEMYLGILKEAGLMVTMMKIYVDDVRQVSTVLRKGSRYDEVEKRIKWSREAEEEDVKKEEQGESKEARMVRVLTPAMNSINPDLRFTAELREDFEDHRLPTLDFKMWFDKDWRINHTYFEKAMRSQLIVPERTAMSTKQKMNIMSNDLVRRLSSINLERAEEGEVERVVEHFTVQLKTSGYARKAAREIVVAGVLGWLRKRRRRKELGISFYRGAKSTLKQRIRKKLIEKTNWYKEKDVSEDEEVKPERKEGESRRGKRKIEYTSEEDAKRSKKVDAKTIIFCPYTKGGELAKQLREAEENMEKATGYRMKIVEEIGEKVMDKLHSSNPWRGEDCKREGCILCETKVMTDKGKKQDCHKRSVVYETWCETCYRQEERRIEEEEVEDTEKELRKKKIKVHKYIGETARSAYERGMEHRLALEKMDEDSHMMKHVATYHEGEEIEEVKFGMRVVSFCRTPLERQVLESVKIQEERQKNITMNSRSEYSRSKIPRLTAKMGDDEYDERRENEKKEDKLIEENVRKEIYRRRKEKCKKRSKEIHEHKERSENNNFKKRRLDEEGKYKTVIVREVEKREEVIEEEEKVLERKKKKPNPPGKILGGVIKGMELAKEIDWQKRREEIIEMMRKDEEDRRKRIEKATKLQKSWELMRECSRILEEGLSTWKTRSEREDDMVEANERAERVGRANAKKMEYRKKEEIKDKCRKITDMFKEVPKTEAQRMATEIRKEEKAELEKLKEIIWKKWRGKKTVLERKNTIPNGEKLDKKLLEVEKRVMEYKNKKEEQLKKRDRKKKEWKERNKMIVEDTWGMLRWLTQYIEENEYDWSRRKEMEKEESKKEKNRWAGMEDEDLIRQVMEQEMHEKVEE